MDNVRASERQLNLVIEPQGGIAALRLADLWAYRELLYFFAWRDIKVRYKQTVLGVLWAIIQPVFTMGVFSIVFGKLGKIPSDGLPYPVFAFAALLPWQLFSSSLAASSQSVVSGAGLITKVYFPRIILPIASVLAGLVDFAVAFGVLLFLMFYFGVVPKLSIVFLPAFIALALISALAVGIWLSALNVKYRDVRYALPFLTQFWLFASPVAYPASIIPPKWQWVYGLNPMAGVIEGFRWTLLGSTPPMGTVYISIILVIGMFVGGLYYFRSTERFFADLV